MVPPISINLLTAEGQQSLVDLHVEGITNYLAE